MLHEKRDRTGRPLLVLDPHKDPDWKADFITDDKETFLRYAFSNTSCELAIDEGGETIGRYARDMLPIATRSRHYGHCATFIAQRSALVDTTVRGQCTSLLCFAVSKKDGEILAEDFVDEELKKAYLLNQGEFFVKLRHKPIKKYNAFEL